MNYNLYQTFSSCYSLEEAPSFSGQMTSIREAYSTCINLTVAPQLDVSLITVFPNAYRAFYYCTSLRKSLMTTSKSQISYEGCLLSTAEIVNIFNNLDTMTENKSIYVNKNPGSANLTAANLLIATNKGWTVVS